jgi:hypothetical protein
MEENGDPQRESSVSLWMMKTEMFPPWDYSFRLALWIVPGVVERVLRRVDREPSYRKIFVLTRESHAACT